MSLVGLVEAIQVLVEGSLVVSLVGLVDAFPGLVEGSSGLV